MYVLAPLDASRLYRMLHQAPSLVVVFASALISLDPSRNPPNRRGTRSLESFVAYKATYALIRKEDDATAAFASFDRWLAEVNCDGIGDPRVLPLHVFDAGGEAMGLDDPTGRKRFHNNFGGPGRREDGSGRIWEKGVMHGGDALRVAGYKLPAGMHWDVSLDRGSSRLANMCEVWKVKAGGYVNVYPDEHIRGPRTSRCGQVRRLWSLGKRNAPH